MWLNVKFQEAGSNSDSKLQASRVLPSLWSSSIPSHQQLSWGGANSGYPFHLQKADCAYMLFLPGTARMPELYTERTEFSYFFFSQLLPLPYNFPLLHLDSCAPTGSRIGQPSSGQSEAFRCFEKMSTSSRKYPLLWKRLTHVTAIIQQAV